MPLTRSPSQLPTGAATDRQPGLLLIISGPSGVGKTSITHRVEKELAAVFSISMTTRPPSPQDVNGADYHFVDEAAFLQARDQSELLEWAQVYGHYYGTPRQPVVEALAAGKVMILEIDVQGAIQIKQRMPGAYALFIVPPSPQVLLDRLRARKRDSEEVIQKRFARAQDEVQRGRGCAVYDAFVVNDELDQAVAQAVRLVRAELSRRRQGG